MTDRKKILVFSGAGVSKESGVETFRDSDGLWNNFKIEDVATPNGWRRDKELVLNFYNERRKQLKIVQPNKAHELLAKLEDYFDVTIATQNVDDLHEKAGSTNVIHLHGELTKVRSTLDSKLVYDWTEDLNLGDKCEKGSQMRPHIVWFGEYPFNVTEAYLAMEKADVLLIVGTSLQIGYTLNLLSQVKNTCKVYYIDPSPMNYLDSYGLKVKYVKKKAVEGVDEVVRKLLNEKL